MARAAVGARRGGSTGRARSRGRRRRPRRRRGRRRSPPTAGQSPPRRANRAPSRPYANLSPVLRVALALLALAAAHHPAPSAPRLLDFRASNGGRPFAGDGPLLTTLTPSRPTADRK